MKKSDIQKILPPGAAMNISTRYRRGVISAAPGELFHHNHQAKLYYDEPESALDVFYAGVHTDLQLGTYQLKDVHHG